MINCNDLVHPFLKDAGTSQPERVVQQLLSNAASIDGRTLADLLNYFAQLSRHINYYDLNLQVSDWQPFFTKSLPFTLAGIVSSKTKKINRRFNQYNRQFDHQPDRRQLQLILLFVYNNTIKPINRWHSELRETGLPVEAVVARLIREKLLPRIQEFIGYANAASVAYGIRKPDFLPLLANDIWNFDQEDLYLMQAPDASLGSKEKLLAFRDAFTSIFPLFQDMLSVIALSATASMQKSLEPLKEELQKKHPPHLGLLFAFLQLFTYLQKDLNGYTKKHLNFFYKDVLRLKPRPATADRAHIIIDIQNNLKNYVLQKGLLVKDGKDLNKAEIFFSLDNELVVNKAQVADLRTLFLNHQVIYDNSAAKDKRYVEGVYMAPNALKADGVKIDFGDNDPKNWPTLGARDSKYIDPEKKFILPYPTARLGFMLASPVLLLNEGKRTVDIYLACELEQDYCKKLAPPAGRGSNCCEGESTDLKMTAGPCADPAEEELFLGADLLADLQQKLNEKYYYVSEPMIDRAAREGAPASILEKLKKFLLALDVATGAEPKLCYCPSEKYVYDRAIKANEFENPAAGGFDSTELEILEPLFQPEQALNISFSGKKDWITPDQINSISIEQPAGSGAMNFTLHIKVTLSPGQPEVAAYDAKALKADYETAQPVVKVELNDHIKFSMRDDVYLPLTLSHLMYKPKLERQGCCVLRETDPRIRQNISLYQFFRNVLLKEQGPNLTKIQVTVCGLKNFVVQNDDSLQDVNGPVYPWGPRPTIIDFDAVNPRQGAKNLVGPNFYLGSGEIFLKKWEKLCINLNWKDKPKNFNEYYKAYLLRKNYHDCTNINLNNKTRYGLNVCDFEVNLALLENGTWKKELSTSGKGRASLGTPDYNRELFNAGACTQVCSDNPTYEYSFFVEPSDFGVTPQFRKDDPAFEQYNVNSRNGFLRFNLQNQDFLHKDYAYVLARQMMALGKYPDALLENAVYEDVGSGTVIVFSNFGNIFVLLKDAIKDTSDSAGIAANAVKDAYDTFNTAGGYSPGPAPVPPAPAPLIPPYTDPIDNGERNLHFQKLYTAYDGVLKTKGFADGAQSEFSNLQDIYQFINIWGGTTITKPLNILIPNEPWTPIISNILLDYTATAALSDIDLIHLHPYEGTYKHESIDKEPPLFPTFCDEGTLYIGLKQLEPGNNLSILFQLAEATADSETEREEVKWHYLDNNSWKTLRKGFEVLNDATDGLTTSGIMQLATPANMTNNNTILPKGLYWIKASIPLKSRSVSEAIALHAQAVEVTFTNEEANDKQRLSKPLEKEKISRLKDADTSVKKVWQPYESFGGRVPEEDSGYYQRVSELLRHKGRAIQKWDYERLALEYFPQLFRAKTVNTTYGLDAHKYKYDFTLAPGYVLLAVVPDIRQLQSGASFEPKVPVSLLEKITIFLKQRTSPFVRLKVMNPRYEKVNICLKVKFYLGKDENYYSEKLKADLRHFIAPWATGNYDTLSFGLCLNQSDIIGFLESLDYVDYILELKMQHENDGLPVDDLIKDSTTKTVELCPKTPRSILIAGEVDVCVQQSDCPEWRKDENGNYIDDCSNRPIQVSDYCTKPIDLI